MYKILGDSVLDTVEFSQLIQEKTDLIVREDISNATKRDDAAGFRLEVSLKQLGFDPSLIYEDEEQMDVLMAKSDEYAKEQLKSVMEEHNDFDVYSYSFDEVKNATLLVMVVMHKSNADRKIRDVIKRLLRI